MPSKQKGGGGATRSLRGLIGGNRKNKDKSVGDNGSIVSSASDNKSLQSSSNSINIFDDAASSASASSSVMLPAARTISMLSESSNTNDGSGGQENNGRGRGGNIIQRLRERSRSRSRAKQANGSGMSTSSSNSTREMLVAVTSCRSDGYYNQKAPGSTFKLPRKAPTNLKLFHELAVGVKDAYAAVGATPRNPNININNNNANGDDEQQRFAAAAPPDETTLQARMILWDFIGNLDFVSVFRCCCLLVGK
jgi:hypothetical protein